MRSAVVALATEEIVTRELAATLASSLCTAGRISTLIWVSEHTNPCIAPPPVTAGVDVLTINTVDQGRPWFPDFPLLNLTRHIAPKLKKFEVVYGLTSGHPLMHAICEGRHSPGAAPYFVAVLDYLSTEHRDPGLSASVIARRFGEKYVLTHCDLIVCLGAAGCQQLANLGVAPPTSRILSSNIQTLQALFDKVETQARAVADGRTERARSIMHATNTSLTICLSHSERAGNATRVLQALDQQSSTNFSVIAVDSSTLIESATAFAQLMEHYRGRGWTYRHEPQCGKARAIALSVARASSKYLMFIDTDDAPEPRLVERTLEAAELSGDDLLEIWSSEVADPDGLSQAQDDRTSPTPAIRASYGRDLVNAMGGNGDTNPVFLVRRTAFDAVGGYPTGLVAGCERQALAVRFAAAGYCCDVLPEILNTRRVTCDVASRDVIREGDSLRRAFDERLNTINMQSFAMTFQTIARELRETEQAVEARQRDLTRRFPIPAAHERLRLLMLVSSFPYPPTSGCLQRWWAMIRFLGQRHDLTLVTFCSSEQSRQRPELLRYCRSVYAAAFGGAELPGVERMPYPVRERMRVTMRDALRSIPSNLYDAALIDTIFLAPFRVEISTPTILGVQNIESRLLMQAAQIDLPGPITTGFHNIEREAELMRDYEDQVWPQFAVRSAVTAQDRDEIQRRSKTGQTILVENGTNPELWLADARPDTDRIIFFGNLGYYPNIDGILNFWHDIWPRVVRRRPSVELVVAGSCATTELRNLAQQPGFVLVEDPPDIREVAAMASVSIVPLRLGSGTNLKILDSMALGLPVVSTSIGCAGLSVKDGEHLIVRDSAVDFAEGVDLLLGAANLWRRIRQNGKAAVAERYRWDRVLAPLESALWNLAR
jgi:glycosyltransferase involved in cell wall biosynthesis